MEDPERLRLSLDRALRFLEGSRNPDGFWSDFLTLAGESVYWVTGYVGYAIARGAALRGEDERRRLLVGAASRLLERQGGDGGWGYGPGVPSDADSTSWCLRFLSMLGMRGGERENDAVRFLLGHQSPVDGGFRTYAKPREVGRYMMLDANVSFEGWSSSQMCVTPVTALALAEAGSPVAVEKALGCVRGGQSAEGFWEPYWWSERLYATVNCMELLKARGAEDDAPLVRRAQDWITRTQLADGGWSDAPGAPGVPFSTALAIRGFMVAPGPEFTDRARRGAEWLLADQLTDGSWNSHHILRIPHPATMEPWKQPVWKRGGRAIGAVIEDHRRLYTTATAFTALSELEGMVSRGEA